VSSRRVLTNWYPFSIVVYLPSRFGIWGFQKNTPLISLCLSKDDDKDVYNRIYGSLSRIRCTMTGSVVGLIIVLT
jgi:hypothetical protein